LRLCHRVNITKSTSILPRSLPILLAFSFSDRFILVYFRFISAVFDAYQAKNTIKETDK